MFRWGHVWHIAAVIQPAKGVERQGDARLFNDLEAIFLDDRIGENFLGDALELLLSFVAVPALEIENEEFALANIGHLRIAEA